MSTAVLHSTCQRVLIIVAFTLALLAQTASSAQSLSDQQLAGLGFDQKLNGQVSLDLPFWDEKGNQVKLGDYFGNKPVILVLGYYKCPMLCSLVMNGMIEALGDIKWSVGNQFEVINISINPREGPPLAAAKKAAYLKRYGRKGADAGWHFLTGHSDSIQRVTEQVGFRFLYDPTSGEYAHPSGLVFLTANGRVAEYQLGVAFRPAEMLASLQQARSEQPGSPVQKLVLLCFHYNPISGKYGPAIMLSIRVGALITILALVWTVWNLAHGQNEKGSRRVVTEKQASGRVQL